MVIRDLVLARSAATCAALLWLAACSPDPAERYLVPEGYSGWVEVKFNVPDAPALPKEDGFRLVNVPEDGRVETSEVPLTGEGYRREYYYVSVGGTRRKAKVGGGFSREDISLRKDPSRPGQLSWFFFIGTPADYERYKSLYGFERYGVTVGRLPPAPG